MDVSVAQFDWNHARAFLATAESGSLSAAARQLGQTQPTVGRQVSALEQELGVALFERVGKSLILTPNGRALLQHVRQMAEAAGRVSIVASGQSQEIEGRISITASEVMCAYVLPPVLRQLRDVAPRLQIDVVSADDLRDLQRREADIAIRHVRPTQPALIARLIRDAQAHLYATPAYLEQNGTPQTLADLSDHAFVHYGDPEQMRNFLQPLGVPVTLDNLGIGSTSGVVAWSLVQQGLGLCLMAEDVAAKTPGVVRVLEDVLEPVNYPIWLTTHRELHTARRIRLVFDLLADFLSNRV
jgi:DNA-binding transcriptional LysR family regulator